MGEGLRRRVSPPAVPGRFRVQALEPRLLLSADPLQFLADSLEAPALPDPAVQVEITDSETPGSTASPLIDWGANTDPTRPADHTAPALLVPEDPAGTPVAADIATSATSEIVW